MTLDELRKMQAWTLPQKVEHSLNVISTFVERMGGLGKVYVSWSGGRDSTVLLDLCKRIYPDILAVFVNTGNEYSSILQFVNKYKIGGGNLLIIHPKLTPRQVWEQYGFPLISKEYAAMIHRVRIAPESLSAKRALGQTEKSSIFALPKKWLYLVDEPYETSSLCCNKLKKEPALKFQKQTGRYPILGIMASESQLREKTYIRNGGCNTFDSPKAKSHPLSIWMPEDIGAYIERYHIPIADIYETGIRSSGCVGCGFGVQFKDDMRFEALYRLQPKYYEMVMNYTNNGVTFREALRKVLATNGLHLPDEEPKELF